MQGCGGWEGGGGGGGGGGGAGEGGTVITCGNTYQRLLLWNQDVEL